MLDPSVSGWQFMISYETKGYCHNIIIVTQALIKLGPGAKASQLAE